MYLKMKRFFILLNKYLRRNLINFLIRIIMLICLGFRYLLGFFHHHLIFFIHWHITYIFYINRELRKVRIQNMYSYLNQYLRICYCLYKLIKDLKEIKYKDLKLMKINKNCLRMKLKVLGIFIRGKVLLRSLMFIVLLIQKSHVQSHWLYIW